jgi:hypothetical protein
MAGKSSKQRKMSSLKNLSSWRKKKMYSTSKKMRALLVQLHLQLKSKSSKRMLIKDSTIILSSDFRIIWSLFRNVMKHRDVDYCKLSNSFLYF